MDLMTRFLPNLNDGELSEEQLDEQAKAIAKAKHEAGRLGPRGKMRSLRNKLTRREAAAEKRKINRRHRRAWLRNEQAYANLRAKVLIVVGVTPALPAMQRTVVLGLERDFGSLKAAIDAYNTVAAERGEDIKA